MLRDRSVAFHLTTIWTVLGIALWAGAAAVFVRMAKDSHAQAQVLATRVERQFDALRAIQTLRDFAAQHGDNLPETL